MGKSDLEDRVLRNPRIEIYGCGRRDVAARASTAACSRRSSSSPPRGLRPTVTSLQCGHSVYTASGNVSHHSSGNAVDIAKVNGTPVLGHQGKGSVTDIAVRRLLTLQGTMKPSQIISLMKYDGTDNTMAMSDHHDHIHVGFTPMYGANSRAGRQLNTGPAPRAVDQADRPPRPDRQPDRPPGAQQGRARGQAPRASHRHRGE
jgi:hypothetical protein